MIKQTKMEFTCIWVLRQEIFWLESVPFTTERTSYIYVWSNQIHIPIQIVRSVLYLICSDIASSEFNTLHTTLNGTCSHQTSYFIIWYNVILWGPKTFDPSNKSTWNCQLYRLNWLDLYNTRERRLDSVAYVM